MTGAQINTCNLKMCLFFFLRGGGGGGGEWEEKERSVVLVQPVCSWLLGGEERGRALCGYDLGAPWPPLTPPDLYARTGAEVGAA